MAEQILNHVNVDTLFKEMGRKAVPQRVNSDGLVETCGLSGGAADALQLTGRNPPSWVPWEQPVLRTFAPPIIAQDAEQLLSILRDYWRRERPQNWLFPGHPGRRITTRQLQRVCRAAAEAAGLDKTVTVHTLRHSFATHLLEQGVDIHVIQDLLGHRNIATTTRYARVAINTIRQIQSPLELLNMEMAAPA